MEATDLLVILAASAVGAGVKGVTGLGYPLFAVPLIALVLGVEDAVVVVAAPNLLANIYLCRHAAPHRHETRDLPRLVGFGILGAALGTVALVHLPEEPLLIVLALTIAGFVVQFVRQPDLHIRPETSHRWAPAAGFVAGTMQGAIGVSGPVVATWMHPYRLGKDAYVFAITLIFGVTGAVQLVLLVAQGEFTVDRLWGSVAAGLPALVLLPQGVRLREKLAGTTFERVVLAVLVLSAVSLVVEVVS